MRILFVLCSILCLQQLSGQTLKGKIIAKDHTPISEAYILNKSDQHHMHSSSKGMFEMQNVKVGDTLVISHLNFKKQEIILKTFMML